MAETVVLVHGALVSGKQLVLLARRLRHCGYRVEVFSYQSRRRCVHDHGCALLRFITGLNRPVVHLVGHSLGGLVILQALNLQPDIPPGRVVLLGSPVRGSRVAKRLHSLAWGRWLLGRCTEDGLLQAAPAWTHARQLGVIAGRLPVGAGLVLGGIRGASDGTVAVAETVVNGEHAAIVHNTTHTGLIFSRAVAGQVCHFLAFGRFRETSETSRGR